MPSWLSQRIADYIDRGQCLHRCGSDHGMRWLYTPGSNGQQGEEMLDAVEVQSGGNIGASVIWMHGLGADGHDFEPIVPHLSLPAPLGGVRFVFPHAPHRPVTINNGYVMRAWYDIAGVDLAARQDEPGIRASALEIQQLIEREIQRGVPTEQIVLAGFSQGGVVALHTGLRYEKPLAGILALSCYLPLAESVQAERSTANAAIPIFMAHGTSDEVIPLTLGHAGFQQLTALGYPIEWRDYPMGHEVNFDEINAIKVWLGAALTKASKE